MAPSNPLSLLCDNYDITMLFKALHSRIVNLSVSSTLITKKSNKKRVCRIGHTLRLFRICILSYQMITNLGFDQFVILGIVDLME